MFENIKKKMKKVNFILAFHLKNSLLFVMIDPLIFDQHKDLYYNLKKIIKFDYTISNFFVPLSFKIIFSNGINSKYF